MWGSNGPYAISQIGLVEIGPLYESSLNSVSHTLPFGLIENFPDVNGQAGWLPRTGFSDQNIKQRNSAHKVTEVMHILKLNVFFHSFSCFVIYGKEWLVKVQPSFKMETSENNSTTFSSKLVSN